jgi:hypothetical protein
MTRYNYNPLLLKLFLDPETRPRQRGRHRIGLQKQNPLALR